MRVSKIGSIIWLKLGINAIEIMPVAQFPGSRNWGYDGVLPFAVQNTYGGAAGLQKLVDACHQRGLAVVLDVVYNHMGPEGNYLGDFGPYFTARHLTPWGNALNFDDDYSDSVRRYLIENVLMWFRDFHIDALRLDAVHAIYDASATHLLREIKQYVDALMAQTGRQHYLIVESDQNDTRYIQPLIDNGYGMDAQWNDEFHHALRVTAGANERATMPITTASGTWPNPTGMRMYTMAPTCPVAPELWANQQRGMPDGSLWFFRRTTTRLAIGCWASGQASW